MPELQMLRSMIYEHYDRAEIFNTLGFHAEAEQHDKAGDALHLLLELACEGVNQR